MTTRTAAEALEEVLALEQKATPGTYRYSPWHVEEGEAAVRTSKGNLDWAITFASDNDAEFIATVVNFIRTHADTLRAALAPPQAGEVEECAKAMDNLALKWPMRVEASLMQRAARLLRATQAQPLTDAQIVEIRDDHLPSQGEPFDCLAFARAVLRATQSATNTDAAKANGSAPPAPGPESGRSGPTFESPAQSAPAQEPVITVSGPVACGKSYVMELIYKALRDAGLHPYSNDLAHERRMVEEQPQPPAKVWKLREAVYAAPQPDEAGELLVELFDEWVDDDDQSELTQRIRAYLEKHK